MDGIRHYISPTSLLPWWFQVSVMPSIFPLLPRAAMYSSGGGVFIAQGHTAKGVSGGSKPAHTLLNEPCALFSSVFHLPRVKNTSF